MATSEQQNWQILESYEFGCGGNSRLRCLLDPFQPVRHYLRERCICLKLTSIYASDVSQHWQNLACVSEDDRVTLWCAHDERVVFNCE